MLGALVSSGRSAVPPVRPPLSSRAILWVDPIGVQISFDEEEDGSFCEERTFAGPRANNVVWSTTANSFAEATAHGTPVSAFCCVGTMDRNGNVLSTRTFIRADPLQGKLPRINPLLNMPFTSYPVSQVF